MKKLFTIIIAILVTFFNSAIAGKIKYKAFTPDGAGKHEFLKSGDKKYKYFLAEAGQGIEFFIKGPTKGKIRIRPAIEKGKKSVEFEIQVWEGDKLVVGKKVKSSKSKMNSAASNVSIGVARDIFFKVSKGKHNYKIKILSEDSKKFYTRFYQKKKKRRPKFITFAPVKNGKTANLKSKKSDITYYLVDNNGGAELNIIGPAELIIYCRVNFDKTMKEKSKFALGIFEDNKSVKKFKGIAKKSLKAAYSDKKDLIPSILHKYKFKVPSGKHTYQLKKVNSAAPSLSIRFKMNANDFKKKR